MNTTNSPVNGKKFSTHLSMEGTPAPLHKRVIAAVLDNLFLGMILGVASRILVSKPSAMGFVVSFVMSLILASMYWLGLPYSFGATPGKKLMGLLIISKKQGDREPNLRMLFVREFFGKPLSAFIFGLGYLWIFFQKERRSWHDMMSSTMVIEK